MIPVSLKYMYSYTWRLFWFVLVRNKCLMMSGLSSVAISSTELAVFIRFIPGILVDVFFVVFVAIEVDEVHLKIILIPLYYFKKGLVTGDHIRFITWFTCYYSLSCGKNVYTSEQYIICLVWNIHLNRAVHQLSSGSSNPL